MCEILSRGSATEGRRLSLRSLALLPVVVSLAALTVLYTYPVVLSWAARVPFNAGDAVFVAWLLRWNWNALTSAPWALLDTNIFYPVSGTLFFSELILPPVLPFGIVFSLTGNPLLAVNFTLLLSILLNGTASAWLAYRWTGDRLASFVAGAILAFSPIMLAQLSHVQLLMYWWTPLALLGVDSYLWRPRLVTGLSAVVCIWLQFITSVYLSFYAFFACLIYAAVVVWSNRNDERLLAPFRKAPRQWSRLLAHGVIMSLVGIALLLPLATEYQRVAREWGVQRTMQDAISFSAIPASFVSVVPENLLYGKHPFRRYTEAANQYEKHLFPGFVVLGIGSVGLFYAFSKRTGAVSRSRALAALLIGVTSVVLALGPYLVFQGQNTGIPLPFLALYHVFPGFQVLRVPARFGLMAVPALSMLAAFGILAFRRVMPRAGAWKLAPWVGVGLLLAESVQIPVSMSALVDVFDGETLAVLARARAPLIWLPITEPEPANAYIEISRMVQNQKNLPMVNGYSGFLPSPYREFQRLLASERADVSATVLKSLGVHTVVLDLARVPAIQVRDWEALAQTGDRSPRLRDAGGSPRLRILEIEHAAPTASQIDVSVRDGQVVAGSRTNLSVDFINNSPLAWVNRDRAFSRQAEVRWSDSSSGYQFATVERLVLPLYVAPGGTAGVQMESAVPPVEGHYALEVMTPGGTVYAWREVDVLRGVRTASLDDHVSLEGSEG